MQFFSLFGQQMFFSRIFTQVLFLLPADVFFFLRIFLQVLFLSFPCFIFIAEILNFNAAATQLGTKGFV